MNAIVQSMQGLSPARQLTIIGIAVAIIAFFGFITTRVSSQPMALLYSQLDASDAGQISQELEKLQIPFQANAAGTEIRVPADQVGKIRMQMAQQGLPKGGSIGYEIFDREEGFGTTSFVQNINHLRALEGELARTIGTLAGISSARVHLVLPRRELFSRIEQGATGSVFLKLRTQLGRDQVAAIQQLVAASVPGLQPDRISVVDDRGNLLARAVQPGTDSATGASRDEMRLGYEQNLAQKIEDLLSRSVGYGKVRAQVTAEMDFDKITTTSEIFDPDSQVVRSTQTLTETSNNTENQAANAVTVGAALPPALGAADGAPAGGEEASQPRSVNAQDRTEETVNFEINRTTRSQVREAGTVRRLSVAVLVDGITTTAEDGTTTYAARSDDEMEKLRALVRSSINFDEVRGDTVEVVNLQFAAPDALPEGDAPDQLMGFAKTDVLRLVETLVMVLVGFLVMFLVVRPLMNRMLGGASVGGFSGGGNMNFGGGGADNLLAGPGGGGGARGQITGPGGALVNQLSAEAAAAESAVEQMIDINRVDGRVKASALRKVGEIIDKHPEEAVSIIRTWLYQDQRN